MRVKTWFPTAELRAHALRIMAALAAVYVAERPVHAARLPPEDELILTILSQSTTDSNSWRGYQALKAQFPSWEAVAAAPEGAIAAAIQLCGLSQQKAPRIKAILQTLQATHGRVTLAHLADLPPDEALAALMAFPGVGRKTASCVLLFSLGMPVMPVDTHVHRVATRLALLPARTSAEGAHDLLEALLPETAYLPFHLLLIAHGRQTCLARRPACERCPVSALCPLGRSTRDR